MPRTRVSERTRWEQLANAVIELGQNVKLLEERVKTLDARVKDLEPHKFLGTSFGDQHVQS